MLKQPMEKLQLEEQVDGAAGGPSNSGGSNSAGPGTPRRVCFTLILRPCAVRSTNAGPNWANRVGRQRSCNYMGPPQTRRSFIIL